MMTSNNDYQSQANQVIHSLMEQEVKKGIVKVLVSPERVLWAKVSVVGAEVVVVTGLHALILGGDG